MIYMHIFPSHPFNSISVSSHCVLPISEVMFRSLFLFWENGKSNECCPYVYEHWTTHLNVRSVLADIFITSSIKNDSTIATVHSQYLFSMTWDYVKILAGLNWYIFHTGNYVFCKFIRTMTFLEYSLLEYHSSFSST